MAARTLAVLRCVLCDQKFSEEDVKNRTFFPETSGCFYCYRDLSKKPYSHTCFGKPNVWAEGKITKFGYDPVVSDDCRIHCPHKKVCKLFHKKKIYRLRRILITPFTGAASDLFRKALTGTSRKEFEAFDIPARTRKQLIKGVTKTRRWIVDVSKRVVKIYLIKVSK